MNRAILLLTVLMLLGGCHPEPVSTPFQRTDLAPGEFRWLEPRDDAMQVADPARDVETWWFDASLDDGTFLGIDFSLGKPFMGNPGLPMIHVVWLEPDREPLDLWRFYEAPEDFECSRRELDVRIGRSRMTGWSPEFRVQVELEEFSCDLAFHSPRSSGWLDETEVRFGDRLRFGWVVPLPQASVTGKITVRGRILEVTGRGYHDHGWGNGPFHRVVDQWYWARGLGERQSFLAARYITSERFGQRPVDLLMFFQDGRPVGVTSRVDYIFSDLVPDPLTGRSHPGKTTIHVRDPELSGWIELTAPTSADTLDPLVGQPRLLAWLYQRLAGRPASFTLLPEVRGELTDRQGRRYELEPMRVHYHVLYFR